MEMDQISLQTLDRASIDIRTLPTSLLRPVLPDSTTIKAHTHEFMWEPPFVVYMPPSPLASSRLHTCATFCLKILWWFESIRNPQNIVSYFSCTLWRFQYMCAQCVNTKPCTWKENRTISKWRIFWREYFLRKRLKVDSFYKLVLYVSFFTFLYIVFLLWILHNIFPINSSVW